MKFSLLCICLFVFICSIPVNCQEKEIYIHKLEQQVTNCSVEEASKLSSRISKLVDIKQKEINKIKKQKQTVNRLLKNLTDEKKKLDRDFYYEVQEQKIRMSYYQTLYPKIEFLVDYFQIYHSMCEFKAISFEKNKFDHRYTCLKNKKKQLQEILEENVLLIEKGYKYQKILFDRFEKMYQEKSPPGIYDSFKCIQGSADLPSYGSIFKLDYQTSNTCLAAGIFEIDSYSLSWKKMIENGTITAGTWQYPNGGLHLGMDIGSPMFTEIKACANGVILYADAPVDSNNGFLGNWCGWPSGGGNTICMIVAVNQKLYAITLAHLSNQIYVYPGQQVKQGEVLALSGNSGNSSGPHTHIEVLDLKVSLPEAVHYFRQGADFSFGNGYENPATCSDIACRIRPELIEWEK